MRPRTKNNQNGLVSILITMFLMLVLTLIVIGFAKLTRREQQEALDRQLSTQAFYAAESGVNDAIKKLASVPVGTPIFDYTNDCTSFIAAGPPTFSGPLTNQLDGTNVQYTCLLVDPSPTSLAYTIGDNQGTVVPMTSQSGLPITSIKFAWEDSSIVGGKIKSGCPNSAGTFPTLAAWTNCTARTLRIDVTPIGGSVDRTTLLSSTETIFLEPIKGGGGGSGAFPAASGATFAAACNTGSSPMCSFTLNPPLGAKAYTLRIRSIYGGSATQTLTISPFSGVTPLAVTGAQAVIDATGKAADVLRRIQVHADISGLNPTGVPAFALASHGSICKRYGVIPGQPLIVDTSGVPASISAACTVQ